MSDVVMIAGKGGTGKTTVSALLTLWLAKRKKGAVLAVDADPNSNLAEALGLETVQTIADIVDEIAKHPEVVPPSMGKDAFVEYKIHSGLTESDGFDLLVMGRPEGPGCYCYINNVLRRVVKELMDDYRAVVVDNEAGLEHFSRKTTRAADKLLVVSDNTAVGLKSAERILGLVEELGIAAKRKFLVINKLNLKEEAQDFKLSFCVDKLFRMPYDKEVFELSASGRSLANLSEHSPIKTAMHDLGEYVWPKN